VKLLLMMFFQFHLPHPINSIHVQDNNIYKLHVCVLCIITLSSTVLCYLHAFNVLVCQVEVKQLIPPILYMHDE
jgi:hypothetical protein